MHMSHLGKVWGQRTQEGRALCNLLVHRMMGNETTHVKTQLSQPAYHLTKDPEGKKQFQHGVNNGKITGQLPRKL